MGNKFVLFNYIYIYICSSVGVDILGKLKTVVKYVLHNLKKVLTKDYILIKVFLSCHCCFKFLKID